MIPLQGRANVSNWVRPRTDVWQVAAPGEDEIAGKAAVVDSDGSTLAGAGLYVSAAPDVVGPGPTVHVPGELAHIAPGDVLLVADDGSRVAVAWKATATHNSILLTERCDHYCLMCSQPPKERDDSYLYDRARRVVSALPDAARAVSLTGGEPTIVPEAFFGLLEHIGAIRPDLSTHILSNGRRFADRAFADHYARLAERDVMVGIPLYAAEPSLHDYVVQAEGAFDETVRGVLNLVAAGAAVELRVVIQKANVAQLGELATFIARNLPFVNQVALMGLEMTGLARPNADLVWVDPNDYRRELGEAYRRLTSAGVFTRIYNHQLCLLDH